MVRIAVFRSDLIRLLLLPVAVTGGGACVVPQYRVAKDSGADKSRAVIDISIRLEDFAPERLVCLAGAIRERYPDRDVHVSIFSAFDAAQNYHPEVERTERTIYMNSKLHGFYVYDKGRGEDYVFIVPDGRTQEMTSAFNTRINLPLAGPPVCKLALDGRCLLEFKHIDYPLIGGKTDGSGEVTAIGHIRPNGAVSDLKALAAKAEPPEWKSILVNFTLENLRTWRFATSSHESSLHITYRFALTDSTSPDLEFYLPDEVRIQERQHH